MWKFLSAAHLDSDYDAEIPMEGHVSPCDSHVCNLPPLIVNDFHFARGACCSTTRWPCKHAEHESGQLLGCPLSMNGTLRVAGTEH